MKNIDLNISAGDTGDIDPRERVSEAIAEEVGRIKGFPMTRMPMLRIPFHEPRYVQKAREEVQEDMGRVISEAIQAGLRDGRRAAHQERLNQKASELIEQMHDSWGRDFHADPLGLQQADIGQMDAGAIRQFCNAFNEESAPPSTEYDRAVSHVGRRLARQVADDIRKNMAHPGASRPFADAFTEGWESGVKAGFSNLDPAILRMAEGAPDPLIPRLAALLGTDDATARDWLVAKVSAFRGESEADTERRLG